MDTLEIKSTYSDELILTPQLPTRTMHILQVERPRTGSLAFYLKRILSHPRWRTKFCLWIAITCAVAGILLLLVLTGIIVLYVWKF